MPRWTLSPSGDHLLCDGRDDVVVADTLWAALHTAEPELFDELLRLRSQQGFNCVMLSVLPIAHDRSGSLHHPFLMNSDGSPDFDRLDRAWLERATRMIDQVSAHGLTPMLMLQWVDYVPGTWASLAAPETVMTDHQTTDFVDAVVGAFAHAAPIWSVSGDDTFTNAVAVERYVRMAARLREIDPGCLVTAHTGGWINFPAELAEAVDFVGYQSSHGWDGWDLKPQQWNRYLAELPRRIPSMNLEPPYEGHGYGGGLGRYTAREVRLASWRSMITGGGAGIGYGAHGVWSWHLEGQCFSSEGWSGMPFDVAKAMRFPGAADVGWLGRVAVDHQFWRLADRADLVIGDSSGTTVGADAALETIVLHSPHAFPCEVLVTHDDYDVLAYDISAREPVPVKTQPGSEGRTLKILTPSNFSEHCYVLTRR